MRTTTLPETIARKISNNTKISINNYSSKIITHKEVRDMVDYLGTALINLV